MTNEVYSFHLYSRLDFQCAAVITDTRMLSTAYVCQMLLWIRRCSGSHPATRPSHPCTAKCVSQGPPFQGLIASIDHCCLGRKA